MYLFQLPDKPSGIRYSAGRGHHSAEMFTECAGIVAPRPVLPSETNHQIKLNECSEDFVVRYKRPCAQLAGRLISIFLRNGYRGRITGAMNAASGSRALEKSPSVPAASRMI
jgi:hypothetical protein